MNKKRYKIILNVLGLIFFASSFLFLIPQSKSEKIKTFGDRIEVSVVFVIDGDTIDVSSNGKNFRVRLVGIDAPEIAHTPEEKNDCFGKEATDEVRSRLMFARVVLQEDKSQGTLDRYGRTLAYVFLLDGLNFNEYLIKKGFAREYTYENNPYEFQSNFKQVENQAKQGLIGMWNPLACPQKVL